MIKMKVTPGEQEGVKGSHVELKMSGNAIEMVSDVVAGCRLMLNQLDNTQRLLVLIGLKDCFTLD